MVTKPKRPKGLGRGLDALLGADTNALDNLGQITTEVTPTQLPTDVLQAGKYQPRSMMDEESIKSLAASIQQQGLMQPIIVRRVKGTENKYEVIAGERRLRAAKIAKLENVPVIIKEVDDENAAIMALIENIQREDLNPLEEARGLKRLLDEFALTHEQISDVIGRSRSATSNLLRLLNLASPVQEMLLRNKIDMGHARALLSLSAAEQLQIAHHIVAKSLSVRETEQLVNQGNKEAKGTTRKPLPPNADIAKMQNALADRLGTTVTLKATEKGKGKLTLDFHDWEQFQGLLDKLELKDLLDTKDF
jgi:ParB family transcriptional regulator, chromosome partitioning protein|uniref:ParB/RepB/Spo0J family partition protein n=1 Tax=Orrella sp. TaxID=1921583 RepID=UPI004047F890